nr:polysaccharide deacetylase family protein [Fredinandcohnia sp. SECRCQ15]
MRDIMTLDEYRGNLLGARKAIPAILELFHAYKIHATWATVGFLFCETKKELINSKPTIQPQYKNKNLSPYDHISESVGENESSDPFHFALSLINKILSYPNQQIGCHTLSHYYCLEEGQDIHSFKADIKSAINIAKKKGFNLGSIVFPRNQYNTEYLNLCGDLGIKSYRGNEASWLYKARRWDDVSIFQRLFRLVDAYFNISGYNTYPWKQLAEQFPINIPSSRFLRPYSRSLRFLNQFKLRRITSEMEYAAKHGLIYHLWWHPHNFGVNLDENIAFLAKILEKYSYLNEKYNFQSSNMEECADAVLLCKKGFDRVNYF